MLIYIATKFENKEAFHALKKRLEECGHEVTHDWTNEDSNEFVSTAQYAECAFLDAAGVAHCDALILLNHPKMAGAYVELGLALALGKHVFLVDENRAECSPCIFFHLPTIQKFSLDDTIKVINYLDDIGAQQIV